MASLSHLVISALAVRPIALPTASFDGSGPNAFRAAFPAVLQLTPYFLLKVVMDHSNRARSLRETQLGGLQLSPSDEIGRRPRNRLVTSCDSFSLALLAPMRRMVGSRIDLAPIQPDPYTGF